MNGYLKLLSLPAWALLASCAIYAPDERTHLNTNLPEQFTLYSENIPDATNRWWTTFQSAELNGLMEKALTNSPTIQQSWARLAQADALAVKAGAARVPSLDYDANASTHKNGNTAGNDSFNTYSLGLKASYEVDLWGRVKSQTQAAALDREASREDLNTVAITLSAQVASRWIGIVAQQLQTQVIYQQLNANETTKELIELRFRKSLSSALDVYQQRQTVASTQSQIPKAELREQLLRNELAVLVGQAHFKSLKIAEEKLPLLGPLPTLGIPADVLANRPDVRKAGLRLQAADWSVSAARADRLPTIRLTAGASYGNSNIEIADVFDNWAANLAASVTGPIFDGGRRKAEVARTRAVVDERLAFYKQTVLTAIKEVEDALVSEEKQHVFIRALDQRLNAARRSHKDSVNRYRNGLVEYTTVLIQLNTLQIIERDRVAAQYDLLQYRINLYRALGGSWPNELTPSKNEDI